MIEAIYVACVYDATIARQNYEYLRTLVHLLALANTLHLADQKGLRQNEVVTTEGIGYVTKIYTTSEHQIHITVQTADRTGVFLACLSALPMTFRPRGKAAFKIIGLRVGDPNARMSLLTIVDGVTTRPVTRRTHQEKMNLFLDNLVTPSETWQQETLTASMEALEVMMVMSRAVVGGGVIIRTGPSHLKQPYIIDARLCDRLRTHGTIHLPEGRSLWQGVIKKLTITPHRFDVVVAWPGGREEDVFWMSSNGANPMLTANGTSGAHPFIGIDSRGLYTEHGQILADTLASFHNFDQNVVDIVDEYLSSVDQEPGIDMDDLSKRRRCE